MGMQEAVSSVFNNYFTFSGRARRAEYWWFILFSAIVATILGALDGMLFGYSWTSTAMESASGHSYDFNVETVGVLAPLWSLATFIPSWAVTVRRLHDTGRSGWWLLLLLIPLIGAVLILIWTVLRGNPGTNAYGPDPIGLDG